MEILQPPDWPRPTGYSNGIRADGPFVFVAGQVGWDADHEFADTLVGQVRQALENVAAVLAEADATPDDIVRMRWYVVDKSAYAEARREIGEVYQKVVGDHYPAMTLVEVDDLLEDEARVEIEATASVSD